MPWVKSALSCLPFLSPHDAIISRVYSKVVCCATRYVWFSRRVTVRAIAAAALLREGESLKEVTVRADAAMYWAKRNGRNQVSMAP